MTKAATPEHEPEAPYTNGAVYQPKPAGIRRLLFDLTNKANEDYRGLEIYARMKIPMSAYFMAASPVEPGDPDYWGKVQRRHSDFARAALVSWNVVYPDGHVDADGKPNAGEPIPCTADGFMELDLDMAVAIRDAWFYTLRTPEEVADPLESESPSSDTSL
jgi:hypothetical protein